MKPKPSKQYCAACIYLIKNEYCERVALVPIPIKSLKQHCGLKRTEKATHSPSEFLSY